MTVRSTQPRPSQQVRGTDRAIAFATATPRRSSSLDAATNRTSSSPLRSTVSFPNPNRSTRRWGTVSVRESDATAETRRELRQAQALGVDAARRAHPAHGRAGVVKEIRPARDSSNGSVGSVGSVSSANGSSKGPASGRGAATANRSASTASASARSNVVALRGSGQAQRRNLSEQGIASGSTGARPIRGTAGSTSGVRGSNKALQLATGAVDLHTDGSTALAPRAKPRTIKPEATKPEATKPQTRNSKTGISTPKLQVARPQRRVAKRSVLRPFSAVFAVGLVLAGAVSAIVMHADLAKNQLVLDQVRREVSAEERTNQRLRVEVAELEAPARLIGAANEIGLVSAERVDYTVLSESAKP
jgi:cell division protein FtsL